MNTKPSPPPTRQPHTALADISVKFYTDFTGHPGTTIKTRFAADITADEQSIIVSHLSEALDRYPDDASNGR